MRKTVSFRKLRAIDIEPFKQNIVTSSVLRNSLSYKNLEERVIAYTSERAALVEKLYHNDRYEDFCGQFLEMFWGSFNVFLGKCTEWKYICDMLNFQTLVYF